MSVKEPTAPDFGDGGFFRIRLELAYDGAPFSGWAVQPGRLTVQGTLEQALAMLLRRPVRTTVAGRTDAGVHARGQVVHIDLAESEWLALARRSRQSPAEALLRRLRGTLSRVLAEHSGAIVVHSAELAAEGFDARFSALWRRYSYRIADRPADWDPTRRQLVWWHKNSLDLELLNQAALPLLGLQDFRSFCKPRANDAKATTVRQLQKFSFLRGYDGVITVTVQADAFCHNMVRALIGSAVQVGAAEQPIDWLAERLALKSRDAKSLLAPAHPLILEEVAYPEDSELLGRAELTRARRDRL
ncbi:tRNA pseudouridine(38-40) synthase TruA [Psychromicrobium lacuslunae]|uniref:tRNA pseudouridine synthase A n=1 Tax=Psychromicrobium lacuslunae TaxID=1618207 RepID=A0A0D4C005_9MICC|nr:tRNA pseudouridine(38-40) synthase TruA [Psychromicrobium lacuslunae]AJT41681.1 pseudouridine synthase [Psychromicrobium lacuslunae]